MAAVRIVLVVLILFLTLLGGEPSGGNESNFGEQVEPVASPLVEEIVPGDPVLRLLGKTFSEIKQTLGEPREQGYGNRPGPHYYMFFQGDEGTIRVYSPVETEEKIAVSIALEDGAGIFGAKTGMTFSEIEAIVGAPDFGPQLDLDDTYLMGYFFGASNQVPEVIVSFAADAPEGPTHEIFIKWEGFYHSEEMLEPGTGELHEI